jgi:hypothetical protein
MTHSFPDAHAAVAAILTPARPQTFPTPSTPAVSTAGAKVALAAEGMRLRDDGTIVPNDGKTR